MLLPAASRVESTEGEAGSLSRPLEVRFGRILLKNSVLRGAANASGPLERSQSCAHGGGPATHHLSPTSRCGARRVMRPPTLSTAQQLRRIRRPSEIESFNRIGGKRSCPPSTHWRATERNAKRLARYRPSSSFKHPANTGVSVPRTVASCTARSMLAAAAGEKAVTGDSKMACTACETMQGGPAGAGPHAGQSLVYRRKEGLAVRLFYVCRLCDTQMLCRLGSAEHDAGWSMTMSGGGPGPVGQMDAV